MLVADKVVGTSLVVEVVSYKQEDKMVVCMVEDTLDGVLLALTLESVDILLDNFVVDTHWDRMEVVEPA